LVEKLVLLPPRISNNRWDLRNLSSIMLYITNLFPFKLNWKWRFCFVYVTIHFHLVRLFRLSCRDLLSICWRPRPLSYKRVWWLVMMPDTIVTGLFEEFSQLFVLLLLLIYSCLFMIYTLSTLTLCDMLLQKEKPFSPAWPV